ncbi:GntR family transcriptional regulator [Pseudonocardia adelaidensis]|uniref:GntR family transcriptional regulator n=1 Tax=Pseudonocardia adelaidensis TaxID=648754 RepID=A0ABP9NHT4_9PSEU
MPLTDTGLLPSRTARVLEIIRNGILSGELAPGSALVEQELATQLGVSKTPVREALKTLEGTGLVAMVPYRGAAVRELTRADADAIYDLRLLLEPEAVQRSVAAGLDLSGAAECLRTARAAAGNAERSMANREFHRQLYAGCGNSLLVATLDGLRDRTALVSAASWAKSATWEAEADEHEAILAAAAAGDADTARRLTAEHVAGFLHRLP